MTFFAAGILLRRFELIYSDWGYIHVPLPPPDYISITCFYPQLENRDREIARLHKQLTGGRPVAALGRDCCYRGIDTLTEDMKLLQQQLLATKKELSESLTQQHEAKLRAIKLDEEKTKYARDLKEMEEFALKFQDEANAKIKDMEDQHEHLVVCLRCY